MKRKDPELLEYESKIRDARESTLFYVELARRAKHRGDVTSFVDCWYKVQFNRAASLYWASALRLRQQMIATVAMSAAHTTNKLQ
jgi:hypothetical protein